MSSQSQLKLLYNRAGQVLSPCNRVNSCLQVPLLLTFSTVTSYQDGTSYSHDAYPSAASTSQIKFAEENNYDDTGPGAKKPEYAYNTYKTLEEALIAYLDDPDTKLPEQEREKAVQKLLKSTSYHKPDVFGFYPKTFHSTAFKQSQQEFHRPAFSSLNTKTYYGTDSKTDVGRDYYSTKTEPFKFQKFQTVKSSPLSLAHYTRNPELRSPIEDFISYPKYSYSYGVHVSNYIYYYIIFICLKIQSFLSSKNLQLIRKLIPEIYDFVKNVSAFDFLEKTVQIISKKTATNRK